MVNACRELNGRLLARILLVAAMMKLMQDLGLGTERRVWAEGLGCLAVGAGLSNGVWEVDMFRSALTSLVVLPDYWIQLNVQPLHGHFDRTV